MAQMAVSEGGRFIFPYTISSALDNVNVGTLQTTNKFLDKDIDIKLTLASGAATVSASKQATSPTIAKTNTAASGATNVGSETITTTAPSSGYFISIQATAPATTLDITKTITTSGYIGADTQITASAATTAKTGSIYYLPITKGVGAANSSSASITIESTDDSSKAGVNVKNIVGTAVDVEPNSGYYLRIKADGSGSSKVTTAGWFPTGVLATSSTSTTKFYPITKAVGSVTGTNSVTPSASVSGSNVTLSDTNNGISVTATGGGTASVTASANITTAGYAPSGNGFASATLNASNNTTTATKYISAITIPSSKSLTITNNGTATITSTGTVTITSNSTSTGTITVAAKTASNDSSNTSQVVVQNGLWKTTAASAATTYYGRVTISAVNGSIGGSAASGSATAAITNTNSMNTITDLTNKTAGTDYWQIKATATGTAGSYTPKYTVSTAGWIASTVTGTAQSVSVSNDSTGKSIYIPKAVFTVSNNIVYCSTAGYIPAGSVNAAVGTVSTGTISTSSTDPGNTHTANTTAVVPSGGYLLLSAGYYSATKISLATLVPNGSNVAGHADYLLAGKTAYDNDGNLVTGNIATYQGDYTYAT